MLSILIPTKNYNCSLLAEDLQKQGEKLGIPYEIIIGEDGTAKELITQNSIVDTLPNCRRIILNESIGRAAIRNKLADEAQYDYLLFIDSDAVVEKEDFLKQYTIALRNHEVVCGGLYHAATMPSSNCSLRFRYEKNADKYRDAETRNKMPYDKFSTFNFAIHRKLFNSIRFNNEITQYGHEDTLFGRELEKRNVNLIHIDNKLLHNGLEDNTTYLNKVEKSIKTLIEIKDIIGTTPLIKATKKLNTLHLTNIFIFLWRISYKMMRKNLTGSNPSLKILAIYKLGYYCNHNR